MTQDNRRSRSATATTTRARPAARTRATASPPSRTPRPDRQESRARAMAEDDHVHARRPWRSRRARARPSGRSPSADGIEIPHLCYAPEPGYRAGRQLPRLHGRDRGRARAGRQLHPQAAPGMKVKTPTDRAKTARKMVFELLHLRSARPHRRWRTIPTSKFWKLGRQHRHRAEPLSRAREEPAPDRSHLAMAVNLDACIQCNLCVRACREVQVNDVIGMAGRGHDEKIVFDFDDPMGDSTCVACGECVQACPTGALMPATLVDDEQRAHRQCPTAGRQRLPVLRRRLPAHLPHQGRQDRPVDGRDGPANENRLCVKGRFGFDYVAQSAAPD